MEPAALLTALAALAMAVAVGAGIADTGPGPSVYMVAAAIACSHFHWSESRHPMEPELAIAFPAAGSLCAAVLRTRPRAAFVAGRGTWPARPGRDRPVARAALEPAGDQPVDVPGKPLAADRGRRRDRSRGRARAGAGRTSHPADLGVGRARGNGRDRRGGQHRHHRAGGARDGRSAGGRTGQASLCGSPARPGPRRGRARARGSRCAQRWAADPWPPRSRRPGRRPVRGAGHPAVHPGVRPGREDVDLADRLDGLHRTGACARRADTRRASWFRQRALRSAR